MSDEPEALRRQAEAKVQARFGALPERLGSLPPEEARRMLHDIQVYQVELEIQNEELRRSWAALEESRARYFELYDLAPIGYLTLGEKGLITEANLTAAKMLGVGRGEMLQRPLTRFILPEDQDIYYLHDKRLLETGLARACELRMLRAGGALFWASLETAAVQREGAPYGVRVMMSDVTERRLGSDALMRAERLEALGVLAGGIAHDFNNLLTAILGNLSLLRPQLPASGDSPELLESAEAACARAKDLSRQMLTFAKGGAPVVRVMDLRPLLTQAAGFAVRGSQSRCVFEFGEEPLIAKADADQVSQVIQNLVVNAVQAMPKGGDIVVRAAVAGLREDEMPGLAAGSYVRVTVQDQGAGIMAETLSKVFDPYFSTKGTGRGLGLAVCRSIMVRHGGGISVSSEPGCGTVFCLHFPAAKAEDLTAGSEPSALAMGSGRILLMDDEPAVTKVLKRMLRRLGYEAESVGDGKAALDAYQKALQEGRPFAAVILDLTVPGGMGGKETMSELAALDPEARGIASSGYADDPVLAGHVDYGFAGRLAKPYRVEELSEVLRRVLSAPRP